MGLIASAAVTFLGETAKPNLYLKKCSLVEGKDDDEAKRTVTTTRYTTKGSITKRYIVPSEV